MNRDALARQEGSEELDRDSLGTEGSTDGAYDDREARSRKNISRWRSYLPEDCVAMMIKMGWDRST
jgi:hypothetical protein